MKRSSPLRKQLYLFHEADERWTELSNELQDSVIELIATLLLQIIKQTPTREQINNKEDIHAR